MYAMMQIPLCDKGLCQAVLLLQQSVVTVQANALAATADCLQQQVTLLQGVM